MALVLTLLPVRVAAMRLGIAYSTLKQWIYAGRLRTTQTAGGHHRVPEEEVLRLEHLRRSPPRPRKAQDEPSALAILSDANRVKGVVEEVRTDGSTVQICLRVNDQRLTAILTANEVDDLRLRRGDTAVAILRATDLVIAKRPPAPGRLRTRERRRG